jgi:hypothetical protein
VIMRALSLKLIKGAVDRCEQIVDVMWVMHRVLNEGLSLELIWHRLSILHLYLHDNSPSQCLKKYCPGMGINLFTLEKSKIRLRRFEISPTKLHLIQMQMQDQMDNILLSCVTGMKEEVTAVRTVWKV